MVQLTVLPDPFEYGFADPEFINGFLNETEVDNYFKKCQHYIRTKHEKTHTTNEISYYPNPQVYGMDRIWRKTKANTRKSDVNFLEDLAQKIEVVFQTRVKKIKIQKFTDGSFKPTPVQTKRDMVQKKDHLFSLVLGGGNVSDEHFWFSDKKAGKEFEISKGDLIYSSTRRQWKLISMKNKNNNNNKRISNKQNSICISFLCTKPFTVEP